MTKQLTPEEIETWKEPVLDRDDDVWVYNKNVGMWVHAGSDLTYDTLAEVDADYGHLRKVLDGVPAKTDLDLKIEKLQAEQTEVTNKLHAAEFEATQHVFTLKGIESQIYTLQKAKEILGQ